MKQFLDIANNKAGLRRLLLSRMLAFLLFGVLALVMLFKVALPLFVSTASVKLNMERALSSWTGARASIASDPDISFWPHPVLTLHAVTFEGGDTASRNCWRKPTPSPPGSISSPPCAARRSSTTSACSTRCSK